MWIVRNRGIGNLRLFKNKPQRKEKDISWNVFHCDFGYYLDDATKERFQDLSSEDEPIEVEIIVKQKRNIYDKGTV